MFQLKIIVLAILVTLSLENFKLIHTQPDKEPGTSGQDVAERFENIIKSPRDPRSYRGLVLKNRMKVILVSDPSIKISAACMVLGVGSLYDFRDAPGLANLVAYTLIVGGSKKYPDSSNFKKFVNAHEGTNELPVTEESAQIFSFNIDSGHLVEALDRFSDMFVQPRLSYETHMSLVESVQYVFLEYVSRLTKNDYRVLAVEKSLCKENHPFTHPVLGDANEFLDQMDGLYDKAQRFYSMYYSSNIMTLAVLGKESLDELESIVTSMFADVKDKGVKKLYYPYKYHPLGPSQLKFKVYVKPLSDDRHILRLNFPVPDTTKYKTLPDKYIRFFMTRQDRGTLSSTLQEKDLCTRLQVHYDVAAGIAFLTLVCDLTNEGLSRVDEIVDRIFQHIQQLREIYVRDDRLFNELKNSEYAGFLNWTPDKDDNEFFFVFNLAVNMQNCPLEQIACYDFFRGIHENDPDELECFLSYLRPDNMNITVVSPSFPEIRDKVTWQRGYRYEKISDKLIKRWSKKRSNFESKPLSSNNSKACNFTISDTSSNPTHPYILYESPVFEIWFKKTDQFIAAEVQIEIDLFSSLALLGPTECILWRVFHRLLQQFFEADLESDKSKSVEWSTTSSDYGMRHVIGVVEKAHFKNNQFGQRIKEERLQKCFKRGSQFIYEVFNKVPRIYGYSSYLQLESGSFNLSDDMVRLYVLHEIIDSLCDHIFRKSTQNQFIDTQSKFLNTSNVRGFVILLLTKRNPNYAHIKLDKFFRNNIFETIAGLTERELESLKNKVEEKIGIPSSLSELSAQYWYEISNRYYKFDRAGIELNQLRSLKIIDLKVFAKKVLDISPNRRRKLTIHVIPEEMKPTKSKLMDNIQTHVTNITNIDDFKNSSTLLPFNYSSLPDRQKTRT